MAQNSVNAEKIIYINEVLSANLFDLSPDFATPEDRHSSWELVYINSGVVISSNQKRRIEVSQGQIVFNRPDSPHTTLCNGKSGAVIFSMIFDCPSPAIDLFDGITTVVPQDAMNVLKKLIEECSKTYNISVYPLSKRDDAPIGGEQIIKNYLETFLILMMREASQNIKNKSESSENLSKNGKISFETRKNSLSEDICDYLNDHLCERVTLDMLSGHFHFGKVYICDVFKKNMGCTIITYHTDLKINEAKRLLRETDSTVTEIADALGFESQSYFTRCFKSRVGYPPQSFRKMLVTNAVAKSR